MARTKKQAIAEKQSRDMSPLMRYMLWSFWLPCYYDEMTSYMVDCGGEQATSWDMFLSRDALRMTSLTTRQKQTIRGRSNWNYALLCENTMFEVCAPVLLAELASLVFEYTDFREKRGPVWNTRRERERGK